MMPREKNIDDLKAEMCFIVLFCIHLINKLTYNFRIYLLNPENAKKKQQQKKTI